MSRRLLLCALLVSAAASSAAAPDATLRESVRTMVAREHIPGLSIAVRRDGELWWSEGFGYANLEQKVPVTPRTRFRIASISKPLTATCVMRLYESGKLALDAPLATYLPKFPEHGRSITVRQLAAHRSGVAHYRDEDLINTVHYTDMTAALTKFQDRPLASAPGTRYLYSSFGYNLLGAVVESVTGQRFTAAMRDCVIVPLGLRDTEPDEYRTIIDNRTAFYVLDESGAPRNAPAVDNSDLWPAGGYLSTAEDLVGFADKVVNGDFLRARTKQLMLAPAKENLAEQRNYALGWSTRSTDGMTVVGHTGSHYGATTRLSVYREARLAVAVLTNVSPEASSNLEKSLLELSDRVAREFIDAASASQR